MKCKIIAVSLLMVASSIQLANADTSPTVASDGTISFTGAITAETCTINVNGGNASPTITLPTVSSSGLSNNVGGTKGATSINIALTNCTSTSGTAATGVLAFFEDGAGVNMDGTVANTSTPPSEAAQGIALQIRDSSNTPIVIGSSNQGSAYQPISGESASLNYSVQYIATTSAVTAGAFAGSVTYSINYL